MLAAVLIVHGTKDDVVPLSHGKLLFKMCKRPHRPFWVQGASHNDIEVYPVGGMFVLCC